MVNYYLNGVWILLLIITIPFISAPVLKSSTTGNLPFLGKDVTTTTTSGNGTINNYNNTYNNTYNIINNFDQSLNTTDNVQFNNVTSTSWFKGLFNWTVLNDWFSFDGSVLGFNDTKLNESIDVKIQEFNSTLVINESDTLQSVTDRNAITNNSIIVGGINDTNGIRSIDPNNRILYASDGTTPNLNWNNANTIQISGATDTASALAVDSTTGSKTYAINAIGNSIYTGYGNFGTIELSGYLGRGALLNDPYLAGYFASTVAGLYAELVNDNNGYAGKFYDGTNSVTLADGTYAINATGNQVISGNVTASYFKGDGSLLTGIGGGNQSFNQSLTDSLYSEIKWAYNQTTPAITDLNNSYGKYWYNMTTASGDGSYNSTYDLYAYNQTTPAITNLNNSYNKWWYNQTGIYYYNQSTATNLSMWTDYGKWWYNQSLAVINNSNAFGRFNQSFNTDGIFFNVNKNFTGIGTSNPQFTLHGYSTGVVAMMERVDAGTTNSVTGFANRHTTTGDMADGFGIVLNYAIQDNAGVNNYIGNLGFVREARDNQSKFVMTIMKSGVSTERLSVNSTGTMKNLQTYSDIVGGTNRDLFVDNLGVIGYVSSSILGKENIRNYTNTTWIYSLIPRVYDRIGSTTKDEVGLIAEEVELVNKDLVSYKQNQEYINCSTDADGIYSCKLKTSSTNIPETVSYSKLVVPLLTEVQSLKKENELLKSQLNQLQSDNDKFKQELCDLGITGSWCK